MRSWHRTPRVRTLQFGPRSVDSVKGSRVKNPTSYRMAPQPWSRTHEVLRDHLANNQWAPKTIPPDLVQDRVSKPPLFPTESDEPLFTLDELRSAIRRIKPNKAPGPDELPADLFTILDPDSEQLLLKVYNSAWTSETTPQEWSEATVVSIFKGKGSDSLPENYRPISLLNAVYKLYAAMLQARLLESCEHKLRPTQFGFRPHPTLHPLFTVRRAMEWSTMTNTPLHLLFLDWKQALGLPGTNSHRHSRIRYQTRVSP